MKRVYGYLVHITRDNTIYTRYGIVCMTGVYDTWYNSTRSVLCFVLSTQRHIYINDRRRQQKACAVLLAIVSPRAPARVYSLVPWCCFLYINSEPGITTRTFVNQYKWPGVLAFGEGELFPYFFISRNTCLDEYTDRLRTHKHVVHRCRTKQVTPGQG